MKVKVASSRVSPLVAVVGEADIGIYFLGEKEGEVYYLTIEGRIQAIKSTASLEAIAVSSVKRTPIHKGDSVTLTF